MNPDEFASATRTVINLASFFEELKQAARDVAVRTSAHARGYFTTSEEEEVRAILVSYWKSRNALFELILSLRQDAARDDRDYRESFAVAFTAALVLVDAARFLREVVEGRPIVRRKLNEAAPQFDIPPNVYDSVQKSLLSARHGWHLYHALVYYEENQESLRALDARADFAELSQVMRRLKQRLDVSVSRFADAKLRTRADQILRRATKSLLGRALYGLQKFAGTMLSDRYMRPGHRPGIPADVEAEVQGILTPGDVLIVRKEYALTNYFLPGYWPHAALYLGSMADVRAEHHQPSALAGVPGDQSNHLCVLEAMKDGVQVRSLASPLGSDSIVVIRPRLKPEEVRAGLTRCLQHAGKPYDFGFDFRRSDRLVCTEVIYRAYDGVGAIELPLVSRVGRPTLSGGDLIQMSIDLKHFEPIAVYAPAWQAAVARGPASIPLLKNGVAHNRNTERRGRNQRR